MRYGLGMLIALLAVGLEAQSLRVSWDRRTSEESGAWRATAVIPTINGRDPVVMVANMDMAYHIGLQFEAFVGRAAMLRQQRIPMAGSPYFELRTTVSIARPDLVSAYTATSWFEGGAHPNRVTEGFTYGILRGQAQRLRFQDLFRPEVDAVSVASRIVLPQLREQGASMVVSGALTSLTPDQCEGYVITPSGISFLFPPYSVASYAEGSFTVKVPFAEFGDTLDRNGPLRMFLSGQAVEPTPLPELAHIAGSVTFRERMAVPPNAFLEVRLLDVTNADAPGVLVADYRARIEGVPAPFRLTVEADKLSTERTYSVVFEITEGDRPLFRGVVPYSTEASDVGEVTLTRVSSE